MPKWKAQKDSEGGQVVRDYGWCEFIATQTYRDNYDSINWEKDCKEEDEHMSDIEYNEKHNKFREKDNVRTEDSTTDI